MKESVLEVLMYLFEQYLDDGPEPDRQSLADELSGAGFAPDEVEKALSWLDGLNQLRADDTDALTMGCSIRVYTDSECARLDAECRGFVMFLEQNGIVSASQRELVLDRLMALESDEVDVEHVKWVVLMVLFNQPGQEEAYARMEDLVFDDAAVPAH
jgi:Smg protein